MPDITNAEAIRFSNEQIRPLSESVRELKNKIDACTAKWFLGMNTTIGSSSEDALQDGRDDEGVSRLSGQDITNTMTQLLAIQTQLNQTGVEAIIEKPCVRTV